MPERIEQLHDWLRANLPNHTTPTPPLESVAGDASFRRYFRVKNSNNQSFIVMDAPPEKEDCHPFVEITKAWREQGVLLPELFAIDLEQGFLLLEDFGDTLLFQMVDKKPLEEQHSVYTSAIHSLKGIQDLRGAKHLPTYDRALLKRELALFTDWLIGTALHISLTESEQATIEQSFEALIESALSQTQCAVHRDYHSRNLMSLPSGKVGIIDFQDAVFGPVTYDLVSLLRDCYIELNPTLVKELALNYKQTSTIEAVREENEASFLKQFDLMGIQRHMKAAGIFARLALRDGKFGYLNDIPRTFNYILTQTARHNELHNLHALLKHRIEQPMLDFVASHTLEPTQ
ncbi:hypothetical protein A3742_11845 [Oleiphilus sp. HI0071]|uniref:aminoglycoside phosphotransferase family protein n=1 Tax=unclassified Oleiphilus TaxID=2631174 RepID=UPI0007C29F0C|nr:MULTISPECIES: phosphotransferase [unclassified Oleiphilus]KZY61630.1 hypothetical protein A3737_05210 [Oleiphilus sp. HI0065]KZY81253.1 hypothetical protein A3742_11845 [Oleiphilus sp. HI0071]KZY92584.1 hypothetical protein A3744_02485 [Oleiphilus sp. HI0073]KZZ50539.1 hypothetical protein A3758_12620 [Oleiphilus sp. HI0118]KZZ52849.1 hypothetical protein A3760_10100 [Oleiphilus sp. HI0122]KZZ70216.1 hypothetical protein A3765_16745 [Oleiphilus sp. HI0130]KZZ82484.1 hypothetical protein A